MTPNPFDQACRYLIRKYAGILAWLLAAVPAAVRFAGWLDTRSIPFPGEPDRVCDTVAHLVETAGPERHWAVPTEFQVRPITTMFGRLLEYLARLWLTLASPDGSKRWCVGAVVVNLSGRGDSSQRMEMAAVGMRLVLEIPEKNLAEEDAAATLNGIAQGVLDRCLLPWIPLMRGGHQPDIIERWKALAASDPEAERRADWGGLVLVFAEAAGQWPAWKQALEGWNVQTSQQVLEWQAEALQRGRAEGKAEGKAEAVIATLQLRFTKKLPKKLQQLVLQTTDLGLLDQWFQTAHAADSLDDFRARTKL